MRRLAVLISAFFLTTCSTAVDTRPIAELATLPAATTARFEFINDSGTVEAYLTRPKGAGPFPLMLLLHGHSWFGIGARRLVPAAETFASEACIATLAVSLPGYGDTKTAAGPTESITRQAVLDALAAARRLPWVDSQRLYVYGFSRGAVVATAMLHDLTHVNGVVLHSGAYDLPRLYRETSRDWLRKLLNPEGAADPKLVSLLPENGDWPARTLILHGVKDDLLPVSQAQSLSARLETLGKAHKLALFPDHGHWLPLRAIKETALGFLRESGARCGASDL
jgi:dipeptidyl aminopeptidase/acylaminoacyl peptidase